MNARTLGLCGMLLAIFAAGCSPNAGFVIRPAPLNERLQESIVRKDAGLFVSDKVAIVDVDGVLMNQRATGGLFGGGENPVSLFAEKMEMAQQDADVKAIVLRINSPGGGVTASDVMYQRVLEFRRARPGVPVIAVMEDVGASGGYYIACSADYIMAHPTTVTGSIGVVMQTLSLSGTMKMIGVEAKAITSGPRKDMLSPFKPMDPEDQKIAQGMVDEFYKQFLDVVCKSRTKMDPARVRELADGRVYTGAQAKANGLVDDLGTVEQAVKEAKKRSGSTRVQVILYNRPLGYRGTVYSQGSASPQMNLINIQTGELFLEQPQFLYLWTGK